MAEKVDPKNLEEAILALASPYFPKHYYLGLTKVSKPETYENEFGEGRYNLEAGEPKLEGTCGEHWSPTWEKIGAKYFFMNGAPVTQEACPTGKMVRIQTSSSDEQRRKSITWALDASLLTSEPFEVDGHTIDPKLDMLCTGGDVEGPCIEWGCWPVKKQVFKTTYQRY